VEGLGEGNRGDRENEKGREENEWKVGKGEGDRKREGDSIAP